MAEIELENLTKVYSDGTKAVSELDLTVPDADAVRDFYKAVVGWGVQDVDMGGYSDYAMTHPATGQPVAGVCHARGVNAGLHLLDIV